MFVPILYILLERLGLIGAGVATVVATIVRLVGQLWPTLRLLGWELR